VLASRPAVIAAIEQLIDRLVTDRQEPIR